MAASNGVAVNGSAKVPLFSFGVIADVQYADIPDGHSFLGVARYYRHSISVLQRAVSRWNTLNSLKFAINFGDIIDGFCPKDKSLWAVQKVLDEFDKFDRPTYHMLGNHCLYNLPRSKLVSLLKMPTDSDRAYYDLSPCPEFRIVVLDAYDFSCLGWPQDHPVTAAAYKLLDEKNPNSDKNSPDGLVGVDRRFVKFNGAVGKEQLSWLNDVLQDASKHGQNVILCSHLPMDPGASSPAALMWNYDDVMSVVHQYNCVKVCFAGHDHKGGYSIDSHGVHHRTLEAALECPPGISAFGHVEVYPDMLLLVGSDREIYLHKMPGAKRSAKSVSYTENDDDDDFITKNETAKRTRTTKTTNPPAESTPAARQPPRTRKERLSKAEQEELDMALKLSKEAEGSIEIPVVIDDKESTTSQSTESSHESKSTAAQKESDEQDQSSFRTTKRMKREEEREDDHDDDEEGEDEEEEEDEDVAESEPSSGEEEEEEPVPQKKPVRKSKETGKAAEVPTVSSIDLNAPRATTRVQQKPPVDAVKKSNAPIGFPTSKIVIPATQGSRVGLSRKSSAIKPLHRNLNPRLVHE